METKPFQIAIPIFKAYQDEDGNMYLTGLGGDDQPDYDPRQKRTERLTTECIADFKQQVAEKRIPLVPRHWDRSGIIINDKPEWNDELGVVVDLIITPSGQMFPKIKLDGDNPDSRFLYKQVLPVEQGGKGKKLGLSWGAFPLKWHTEYTETGLEIRVFDKMELWHFVPTTRPITGRSLNNPLRVAAKSVDWDSGERIKIDHAVIQEDFPEREAVEAIYKSFRESEGKTEVKPEEAAVKTKVEKEDKSMTPDELKALQEAIGASFKSAVADVVTGINTLSTKVDASAKSTADQLKETLDAAVKAMKPEPPKAEPPKTEPPKETAEEAAAKAKAVEDMVKDAVNKALEPFMAGLKSKAGGDGTPPAGDAAETEFTKALAAVKSRQKCIQDFPPPIQQMFYRVTDKAAEPTIEALNHPRMR